MIILCTLLYFFSCASPKAPTGGADDVTPPQIVEAESTPNKQTNFREEEIILTFDEWVSLKDVYTQLVISPLMPDDPEIRQKGKAIIIELPEGLREETTYTLNFGNAITDLNEGNILENYSFVFSTGSALDSITVSGLVVDAVSQKPAPGVWVMLHPVDLDSAVYKRKPEYLAKTNDKGRWSIPYVRVDSFIVVALKDENVNFLYDQEAEVFGWLTDPIYTGEIRGDLQTIYVFPRPPRPGISNVIHTAPGWLKLVIPDAKPKPFPLISGDMDTLDFSWDGDTLQLWYNPETNFSGIAVLHGDTTIIRQSASVEIQSDEISVKQITGRLHPNAAAKYRTLLPVATIDSTRIHLTHDSLGNIQYSVMRSAEDKRVFSIKAPWHSQNRYFLTMMPGAIRDIWGRTHDTIRHSIVISAPDQFGDLTITVDGLEPAHRYILFLKEGNNIVEEYSIEEKTGVSFVRRYMPPGSYSVEIIEDNNGNGMWDTGNYALGRQPERKKIFSPETLRAGWDLEIKMTWQK